MKVKLMDFNGIDSVGLYAYTANKYLLLGREVQEKYVKDLEKTLGVKSERLTIAGTSFINVFMVGEYDKILVPSIIFSREKEILEGLGFKCKVVDTINTCLGNNILLGEEKILASIDMEEEVLTEISKFFEKPVEKASLANVNAVSSLVVQNKNGVLASSELSKEEVELIQKALQKDVTTGTINMGSQYIKSGVICNDQGLIVGSTSGGPEITNADEALK